MRILAIQNCEAEGFGLYERYLIDHEVDYSVVHPYRDGSLPPVEDFDAILIGGTPVAAYELHQHPFLQDESAYLQQALRLQVPCLGICFGAQILALILGADVRRCAEKEVGTYEVRLTAAGRTDPVLEGFAPRFSVFQWHGDTFDVPAGAALLAQGDSCRNQLFRRDNVVGVQFHLEVTCHEAAAWADVYADELAQFGKSKAQLVDECRAHEDEMRPLAERLLQNVLEHVA